MTPDGPPEPTVSVLMPVAAPAPFLDQALASVVAQTLTDWQLVLVADGPAELVVRQARALVPADRLDVVELPRRLGVAAALNAGLAVCRSGLVARLDADDRADPHRLRTQAAYLNRHPDVGLLGTGARLIDVQGQPCGERMLPTQPDLRMALLSRNRFVHSSVMFRRDLASALGGYDPRCDLREDYELWLRMATRTDVANLDAALVDHRVHPGQASRRRPSRLSLRLVRQAQRDLALALDADPVHAAAARWLWRGSQSGLGRALLRRSPGLRAPGRRGPDDRHRLPRVGVNAHE